MDAIKAIANHFNGLFRSVLYSQARKRKATNKTPCIQPTIVTAIGCFKTYFSGMAMQSNTKNEIPSAIPVFRSQLSFLFMRFYIIGSQYQQSFLSLLFFPAIIIFTSDYRTAGMTECIHSK